MGSEPEHLRRGRCAEERALTFLQAGGLTLVQRNYRCKVGELDLIMRNGPELIFVEVRYRSSPHYGGALETIDGRKQRKLWAAAQHYLQATRALDRPCRFDVIAIGPDQQQVTWIKNAFQID